MRHRAGTAKGALLDLFAVGVENAEDGADAFRAGVGEGRGHAEPGVVGVDEAAPDNAGGEGGDGGLVARLEGGFECVGVAHDGAGGGEEDSFGFELVGYDGAGGEGVEVDFDGHVDMMISVMRCV